MAACAGRLLAFAVTVPAGAALPPLPAPAHYASLPTQFDQALSAAHARAAAPGDDAEAVRKLALLYQANRLYPEARACYRVLAATPAGLTARDHYYLADIALNESDLDGAEPELRAVLQAAPDYLPARLALAEALFKTGREEAAEKEYQTIVAKEINQPQASLALARIDLQRGHDDAAVARLEELMAAHPAATDGAALFAKVLERRGDNDRAVALAQMSQQKPERQPPDPWKDALLADCYDALRLSLTFEEYFKSGRMEEAVPLLDRLQQLDPTGPITMMFAGFSHAKALQHITAIREYYDALAKGGDPEKVGPLLVQSLLALGKVDEAAGLMADLSAKMPGSIPLAKAYAEVAVRQGNAPLAIALLEKVLQKEPYLQAQNMSLAKILWTAGQRDEAARCLQRIAAVFANDVPARALLGEYYLGKSDPVSAIKPLEQALPQAAERTPAREQLAAMLATAYLQAGGAEAGRGRLAEAADYCDKAIGISPGDLKAYALKADLCAQLKQFRRAADALEKMGALQPDNPTILLSLGDVLYQDGDKARAERNWQLALQRVAPGDAALRSALTDRLGGRISAETFQ